VRLTALLRRRRRANPAQVHTAGGRCHFHRQLHHVQQSLLAVLSDRRWPILQQLRLRLDDFTTVLLDAWALAGDVVLPRTHRQRIFCAQQRSVHHCRTGAPIGYQLAPGSPPARISPSP
jgi:hypothetical protein